MTECIHEKPTIAAITVVMFLSDEIISNPSLPYNILVFPISIP